MHVAETGKKIENLLLFCKSGNKGGLSATIGPEPSYLMWIIKLFSATTFLMQCLKCQCPDSHA